MNTNHLNACNSIPAFYAGRSIFVTGGTGFMGKVLIEKLLRSCDVREIFLLMRPKKGLSIDERLNEMLSNPLFDRLKKEKPNEIEKLIPVMGDAKAEGLGLSAIERQFLIERVSVIFHVAANVRFDDNLRDAVFINLRSTRDICILAANMKKLVALVHVSSTYTQADKPEVEEKLYPGISDWKKMIKVAENIDDDTLRIFTPKYLGGFPNTYTFTKRLAEQVIADYAGILPIVLFRPSIVISTMKEPVEGWLDNFNGPVGMMVGGGKGILRVWYLNTKLSSDFIPVDVAIKAMIAVAWKRGNVTITRDPNIHVYNCASSNIKSVTSTEIMLTGYSALSNIPLEGIMWHPHTTLTESKTLFYVLMLLFHLIPALIIDGILKLSGRKPILVKLHRKIYTANSALEYFLINEWKFRNENLMELLTNMPPTDVEAFGFEYFTLDIHVYFTNCLRGAKQYLLKESLEKLPEARKHYRRMMWLDRIVKVFLVILGIYLIYRYDVVSKVDLLIQDWLTTFSP